MFQLWVQERAAASTLPVTLPEQVAKSLLGVGDVVMRRQDTSRTRVQVSKATVCGRHACDHTSSILVTSCQAPLEKSVLLQPPESESERSTVKAALGACGALSRLFRGAEKSMSSLSFFLGVKPGSSRDAMVGFVTPGRLQPSNLFAAMLRLLPEAAF